MACHASKHDRVMALFRYFNPEEKQGNPFLPDLAGPLPIVVPSLTVEAANKAVKSVLDEGEKKLYPLMASMKPFLSKRRQL